MVDRRRVGRVWAWVATLRRPASAGVFDRGIWAASLLYLVAAVGAATLLWGMSDRWWPATTLLFGPRWVLLTPLAVLIPLVLLRDVRSLLILGVAAATVWGPVMGGEVGWRSLLVRPDVVHDVTVVSLNARGGPLTEHLGTLQQGWDADLLLIQECGSGVRRDVEELGIGAWMGAREQLNADARSGLCLVSRFPIRSFDTMEREALRAVGGSGLVVTYTVDTPSGPIAVTNIHLETPRAGFELLRAGRVIEAIPVMREKSELRRTELSEGRRFADQSTLPRIVAGDFNTPVESVAYRSAWNGWTNAFSQAGWGTGGTRLNGWIRPRIDHVLVDRRWKVVSAEVGQDVGSDHLPMIARIRVR